MNKINNRLLSIFGNRLPALKKIMQKTGCVISGSFIIQCLLDETWKNTDIDFYVPMPGNKITKHIQILTRVKLMILCIV
jgi:hypothetical protein